MSVSGVCSWSHFSVAGSTLWTATEWSQLYSTSSVKSKKKQVCLYRFRSCCSLNVVVGKRSESPELQVKWKRRRSLCGAKQEAKQTPALCGLFHHQQIIFYSHSYATTLCWIFSHNIVHYMNFIWQVRRVPAVALKSVGFSSLFIILIVFWVFFSYNWICGQLPQAALTNYCVKIWMRLFLHYCAIMESIEQNCHKQQWCLPLWVNCQVWWIRLFFLCRVSLLKRLWGTMLAE